MHWRALVRGAPLFEQDTGDSGLLVKERLAVGFTGIERGEARKYQRD